MARGWKDSFGQRQENKLETRPMKTNLELPAGRIIPFDTYNLFYRDGRIEEFKRNLGP
jgi:hypothetical protein